MPFYNFCFQVLHKKTFYYLEQLIIKHGIHSKCLNIKQVHGRLNAFKKCMGVQTVISLLQFCIHTDF